MSAGGKQSFLRNWQKFVLDDTDHVLQTKVQEILQWMSSSSISWTKAELPFNVQKHYQCAKHVIDCSPKPADCLSLPKASCAVFISSEMCSICFHPTIRCMPKYLKPSWRVAPNHIYYGIFFPHWNGAFGRKSFVLLSVPCSAEQPGACQAQAVWRTLHQTWTGSCLCSQQQTWLGSSSAVFPQGQAKSCSIFSSIHV